MRCVDPGHSYLLTAYDAEPGSTRNLVFMKREGPGYPFNVGHYPGTNCQEVIRALIDRVKYLDRQIACPENAIILAGLRSALAAFEIRAARRHGRELSAQPTEIENAPICQCCGHIGCSIHSPPQSSTLRPEGT